MLYLAKDISDVLFFCYVPIYINKSLKRRLYLYDDLCCLTRQSKLMCG